MILLGVVVIIATNLANTIRSQKRHKIMINNGYSFTSVGDGGYYKKDDSIIDIGDVNRKNISDLIDM
jgi:hypothetical protein